MRTTSDFKVGAHEYQVNMWHPDKAIENLTWLTKLAGEPLLAVFVNIGSIEELMSSDVDLRLLAPAVKHLFQSLNEKEVVLKVNQFTEDMLCDGAKVVYASHFMGRTGHLMKVVTEVLKAQYADFFDEIPAGILASGTQKAGAGQTTTDTTPAH